MTIVAAFNKHKPPSRRPSEHSMECGFSLDRAIHASRPPNARVDYVRISGPVSYSADLNLKHGDLIAITPDRNVKEPDDLILTKWKGNYFIRKRKWNTSMYEQAKLRLVDAEAYSVHEVLGVIMLIVHPTSEVFAAELDHFF